MTETKAAPKTLSMNCEGDEQICSFKDFVESNMEDSELIDSVRALAVGESMNAGGGAAPLFTITVLS